MKRAEEFDLVHEVLDVELWIYGWYLGCLLIVLAKWMYKNIFYYILKWNDGDWFFNYLREEGKWLDL